MTSTFSSSLRSINPPINQTFSDSFDDPASEVFYPILPLIKAEVEGAVIVAPGLKVKVAGGLNFPSTTAFRLGVVYLVGAR